MFMRAFGRGPLAVEQPPRQVLLVKGLEDILTIDVAEEHQQPVELRLHLLLRRALVAHPQHRVDVLRYELRRLVLPHVDEVLARLLQRVREALAARKGHDLSLIHI